jgi:hypothetical protein
MRICLAQACPKAVLLLLVAVGCAQQDTNPVQVPVDPVSPSRIADLAPLAGSTSSITFTFTAPGDDGDAGQATAYQMLFHTYPVQPATWESWDRRQVPQTPQPAGYPDTLAITGLTSGSAYAFLLRAQDEAGNWSEPSNLVIASAAEILDTTPPAAISDLDRWESNNNSVTVAWSAVGDDGPFGSATAYELRFADFAITEATWNQATPVAGGDYPEFP